ncbi:STAS/SEC14 domain-containing protein [Ferruginibacter paludis]|uniref:STAS/SEC14 domain-containing protein n=1 Tax=Ferruginibacter paludis TaxID=1310417 RepID=UPI0025B5F725|nr:STAS/SEC14 domain-containing protein [Ferruginibacter paludis]MDN3656183.1 STAS/SEC14 domain-containing protein [Ferruginibacter paludis]
MIQLLNDVPGNVAGFRALGKVTKADYDHTVIPRINETVKKEGKINFMLVLDTTLADFTIGAIIDDLAVGLKHFTKWHKMAIVSESADIKKQYHQLFQPNSIYRKAGKCKEVIAGALNGPSQFLSVSCKPHSISHRRHISCNIKV